jgi:LmbE family N-acetylglucosaminyl deacetylase
MDNDDNNEENQNTSHKILIKTKDDKHIELKTDSNLENLFNSLMVNDSDKNTHSSKYIMRLDQETMQIKLISKDELISGKTDLEEYIHPYFMNLYKDSHKITPNENDQEIKKLPDILKIEKNEKILLFSPHPDDEILGACGLLYLCFIQNIKITVIYMTSGKTAGDANIRQKEAINGINKLGGSQDSLFFTCFPFYNKQNRSVENEDYEYARELIRKYQPDKLFICADIFDPNRTHKKCFDILMKVVSEMEFKKIEIYFYYSVWYWPEEYEFTHILPYDYDTYKLKIYAMLEHKSQIETKFMGSDPRPFYQRATVRDTNFGKQFNYDYCEIYFKHQV